MLHSRRLAENNEGARDAEEDGDPSWLRSLWGVVGSTSQPLTIFTARPSVCLSDAGTVSKQLQLRSLRSSLEDSPMTLVFSWLTLSRNSKGSIGSEGAKWERGRKNRQFLANKCHCFVKLWANKDGWISRRNWFVMWTANRRSWHDCW